MNAISDKIKSGARSFLKTEYTYLAVYAIVVFAALLVLYTIDPPSGDRTDGIRYAASFLTGATLSALSGYLGMSIATDANVRTTQAALEHGLPTALRVSFTGGAVMGFTVVSFGLLGLSLVFMLLTIGFGNADPVLGHGLEQRLIYAGDAIAGFGFGASSIALFARVAGGVRCLLSCGVIPCHVPQDTTVVRIVFSLALFLCCSVLFVMQIYTKAADVGADLVGKVEMDIPEDDPRNPAVIADNVGDNVGDVAGMGADLFESFVRIQITCIHQNWLTLHCATHHIPCYRLVRLLPPLPWPRAIPP
jgi:K(+)-stimulated pyrophosphate-energized sodium pump